MNKASTSSAGYYFDENKCMARIATDRPETTLSIIVNRYTELNPRAPVDFRAFCFRGILCASDYRYLADFGALFPDAQNEQCVTAWSMMWVPDDSELMFDINCFGPIRVMVNGDQAWRSNIFSERYPDKRNRVTIALKKGWNSFVVIAKKTRGGFGWILGSWLGKHPYVFMMPSADRQGQEGWLYTDPHGSDFEILPTIGQTESETGIDWNPHMNWSAELEIKDRFTRIYGSYYDKLAIAWTVVDNHETEPVEVTLKGHFKGKTRILLNNDTVVEMEPLGSFSEKTHIQPGRNDIMVCVTGNTDGWGFDLDIETNGKFLQTESPCAMKGSSQTWLHAGPFDPAKDPETASLRDLFKIHHTISGPGYWRLDAPDTYLRIYNDNPLFGRWNYPLGVTVYGLLHAGLSLQSQDVVDYVRDHVQVCCTTYPYSKWDRSQFGGPTHVHRLLSSIDSLDDCGSFGSCMLEVAKHTELNGYTDIAHFVADYVSNKQDRFPDGTFYRRDMMHAFHENTMWADDLYMSVPFLCRYYQLTGDIRYINDAARQFLGFRKRLYIPEQKVMSHVFDLRRNMATGVPWGRGNGWTIFSLSELLAVLPEDHVHRQELLEFFREICSGILNLQDEQGMWHQVLTHPDAYPETSCTAMFIYGFSRGIRFGWLEQTDTYIQAVFKAWTALNRISIDQDGNIYGVCRGSEFSFTPDYYKNELLPRLNDTHGIGIVLLAGVEVIQLKRHLEQKR
ncbi:MAG: glycoside hydrolase family 88 protein [Opitutales bacterium]|nr:glycoside hydrolase family 88 protein [Opitutales bacterium]